MKILITGACGFVGNSLAGFLPEHVGGIDIVGIDNLMRHGSEVNRRRLERQGVRFFHGDLRLASDVAALPRCDWVIDAAANSSVLAGTNEAAGSRRLFEENLLATGNLLEYCREHQAGLLLLSSSRVYSIPALTSIPLRVEDNGFVLDRSGSLPCGLTNAGIGPDFSTAAPISLYGGTKLASEVMALEYGFAYDFPIWITRCGVLAGAGQFGTAAQGIFAYWVNAHLRRSPMRYTGFDGTGYPTRDACHPRDLGALLIRQMADGRRGGQRVYTAGGGPANTISLAQLTRWCDERFGAHEIARDLAPRPYDVPWVVMDSTDAGRDFAWSPETSLSIILEEIAQHALTHPEWLEMSGA